MRLRVTLSGLVEGEGPTAPRAPRRRNQARCRRLPIHRAFRPKYAPPARLTLEPVAKIATGEAHRGRHGEARQQRARATLLLGKLAEHRLRHQVTGEQLLEALEIFGDLTMG